MEKVECFCVGKGKVSCKGATPFCYQGEVYHGMLKRERFIGNRVDYQQCLLWLSVKDGVDYWSISTSVIWRVVEIALPLSPAMDRSCFLLPLISQSRAIEVRGLSYVQVVKKKGLWTLRVRERGALWLFNTLHRLYGEEQEVCVADTFLTGFVDTYC